jgi:hypothetical protein
MTPVVRRQLQADADYFHISYTFDLVPHNLLLHESSPFVFSGGYVNWFHRYLTNRQFLVRVSGTLSLPFQAKSGVPEISLLRPFHFNVFINDLRNSINHSKFLIIADLNIFRVINFPHDCLLLSLTLILRVTGVLLTP